ncbi:MAG: MoxR family ATPase [Proteobacteria bacterium]|nr:MoxR family ATPase [Pseudomonadota bacterium]
MRLQELRKTTPQPDFEGLIREIGRVVLGKEREIRLALTCLFADGHLLIEDMPGIGKTTLAKVLARCLGLDFARIQCTSDMLPGDILGTSVFDRNKGSFVFHPGPVFTQVLLADEINRATPKTQSALLEAMEERQVTTEGETRPLPSPFFVIATQNPFEHSGTFPLPESQFDRFLIRINLGYPGRGAENQLLRQGGARNMLPSASTSLSPLEVLAIQEQVNQVHVSDALLEYVQDLLDFTRNGGLFATGLSPRAGLAILQAARAWALLSGRDHGLPEDVQAVLPWVTAHRLRLADTLGEPDPARLASLFSQVPVP